MQILFNVLVNRLHKPLSEYLIKYPTSKKKFCNKATNKKILLAGGMASISSSHSQRQHHVSCTTSTGNDSKQSGSSLPPVLPFFVPPLKGITA
jgi:hypothetical protein